MWEWRKEYKKKMPRLQHSFHGWVLFYRNNQTALLPPPRFSLFCVRYACGYFFVVVDILSLASIFSRTTTSLTPWKLPRDSGEERREWMSRMMLFGDSDPIPLHITSHYSTLHAPAKTHTQLSCKKKTSRITEREKIYFVHLLLESRKDVIFAFPFILFYFYYCVFFLSQLDFHPFSCLLHACSAVWEKKGRKCHHVILLQSFFYCWTI